MKTRIASFLTFGFLLFFFYSCQHEENPSPAKGSLTFSFSQLTRSNGRVKEAATPAYILLSIKDSNGSTKENVKLSLFDFGEGYVSENLEQQTGSHHLVSFAVLDATNEIIYATPMEGSDMAKYVTDPLPIEFVVKNEGTLITPQVLAVFEDDKPEIFGYGSFGFEVVEYNRVRKVTLDGISVQDTLSFYYTNGKISTVNSCTYIEGASSTDSCLVGYAELRHYNDAGKLSSISGRWDVSYYYENGLRKEMVAYFDDKYFSTTTFLEYSGSYPKTLKVDGEGSVRFVDLTFNAQGDLSRQTIKDHQGILLADYQMEYSSIANPIQGMMETVSYAVEFFGFNNFAFYYSQHVPVNITNPVPTQPGNPVLQRNIHYEYMQDSSGRLISGRAYSRQTNVHNLFISYDK